MWEIGRWLGHCGDHPHPQIADRITSLRMDKRVAPDREGAADKQCQGEGKLWSQYVITNCEKGKGKPPRLFPKTGYPLGYPEPALQQKTEERDSSGTTKSVKSQEHQQALTAGISVQLLRRTKTTRVVCKRLILGPACSRTSLLHTTDPPRG